MECSWDELLHRVKDAEDLDQIIAAHQEFLDTITNRSLLDPQSKVHLVSCAVIGFDLKPVCFSAIYSWKPVYHIGKISTLLYRFFDSFYSGKIILYVAK